ncbi:hypothetical protein BH11BAC5_BH11BAC5_12310 [soil metagenome]
MKCLNHLKLSTVIVVLFSLVIGCNQPAEKATEIIADATPPMAAKADPAKMKADIQAQETAWATADNARDVNTVANFYADDAVSLSNNQPMLVGKAAIQKDIEAFMAKRPKGSTISYEALDAFGDGNFVTEVGKTTSKDSTGKVYYAGKYMAIWEQRNGKYVCIRDINNDDVKAK